MAQQQFLTCLSGSASPLQLMASQNPSPCYASPQLGRLASGQCCTASILHTLCEACSSSPVKTSSSAHGFACRADPSSSHLKPFVFL